MARLFSSSITVNHVNRAPVLSGIEATALSYTENDPATAISSAVAIADGDIVDHRVMPAQ